MTNSKASLAALTVLVLSSLPLARAEAAGPGYFVAGGLAHAFFGLATLPLAIIGAAAGAATQQADPAYAPPAAYYGGRPVYAARPMYAAPPGYAVRPVYGAPPPAYYPPAYYAPRYYAGPRGYSGARAGYTAGYGYQVARRPGYYHYPR